MNISLSVLASVYKLLTNFADSDSLWSRFDSIFGAEYDDAIAKILRSQWQARDFSQLPKIEVISSNVLGLANAAYSTTTNKIYISDRFLASANSTTLSAAILEEIGHFVDAKVNDIDTKGDEGELFSNIVRGVSLSTSDLARIQADNDWGQITLNGQTMAVEQTAPVIYETAKIASGVNGYGIQIQASGTNAAWVTQKNSNYVLNFFNGTTVTPIANSVYTGINFDVSGSTVVYAKNQEIYRYNAGTTTKLTTNTIRDYAPQIDGTNVVWYANDGTDVEIFRNNGTTTTQLTNNTSDEYDLKISGSYTTWAGWDGNDYEIYLNNGTSTTQVTNNTTDDFNPVISSNKLAWLGWNGTTENLFYYNGTTVTQATTNLDVRDFKISGDKVVYTKYDGTNYSLQLYNGTTKTTTQLGSPTYSSNFQVDGNQVVWQEDGGSSSNFDVLKLFNGTSTTTLSDRLSGGGYLLSGNKVAYIAVPNTTESYNYNNEVFLYDGTSTTQLTEDTLNSNYLQGISGSNVLWSNSYNTNDLYLSKPSTKIGLGFTNSLTLIEGQTSPQNAVLTVTLSAASTTNVTVSYTTEPSTNYPYPTPGQDYTTTSGTLTFLPGELTKTITVPILDDNFSEQDETFYVKLSNLTGAILIPGQSKGVVTISDTLKSSVTASLVTTPNIENLTLTGTANINGTGNVNNNTITGNSGNNILDGGGGSDNLSGGLGNDTYIVVDYNSPYILENANEGTDTVQYSSTNSFGGYTLYTSNVENLTLTGTGNLSGDGNSGNNVITGNSGNNTLDGQGGVDTLVGGLGDDLYQVDTTTDTITELAAQGTDTVESSVTFSLAALANVENLTLTGSAAINGTGNAGNNVLKGNSAINILSGGLGNDTYIVDSTADTITELTAQGTDTVQSSVTFSLAAIANVENLTLENLFNYSAAIDGTGNGLNNVITAKGGGNNILNGGAGADTLVGSYGDDTYIVDSTTDVITELSYQGTDNVQSSATFFTLSANVENLTLTGTANINGTGNVDGNNIIGNSGNNIIDGGNTSSSFSTDSLQGGAGNDTYIVSGSSYQTAITENLNEGTDTVQYSSTNSFDSYTLGANLENLTLTGTTGISGYGNTLGNTITGNSGNNSLYGNAGNDYLFGGAGNNMLDGGVGTDLAYYYNATAGVTVNLATGTASNNGQGGTDTLFGIEFLVGSNTAGDNLTGDSGANNLYGYGGNDTLTGGLGNDMLYLGVDTAIDAVNYTSGNGSDTVFNFVRGVGGDRLNFTGILAIDVQVSGTNTLFKLGDGISGNAGFGLGTLLLTTSATTGFVVGDANVNLFGATFAFS